MEKARPDAPRGAESKVTPHNLCPVPGAPPSLRVERLLEARHGRERRRRASIAGVVDDVDAPRGSRLCTTGAAAGRQRRRERHAATVVAATVTASSRPSPRGRPAAARGTAPSSINRPRRPRHDCGFTKASSPATIAASTPHCVAAGPARRGAAPPRAAARPLGGRPRPDRLGFAVVSGRGTLRSPGGRTSRLGLD